MESDGIESDPYTQLYTQKATNVVFYLAAATDNREENPEKAALDTVEKAAKTGYNDIKLRHIEDFYPYMASCTLSLGEDSTITIGNPDGNDSTGEPLPHWDSMTDNPNACMVFDTVCHENTDAPDDVTMMLASKFAEQKGF